MNEMSRRSLLKGLVAAGATAGMASGCNTPGGGSRSSPGKRDSTLIRRENELPGTRDWLLRNTRVDPSTKYRCPWIEGYCSHTSIRAGEELSIFVSTNPPSPFTIDIYRMGFYGGTGGRHVFNAGSLKGITQADPPVGEKRLRECQWERSCTVKIPRDWVSGVYLGKLTAEREGMQSYIIFIVRDDRPADLIFQCSDNTWQAYNRWPNQFSLYDNGVETWYWGPNVDISFDRPYGKYCQIMDAPLSTGSGEWFLWEYPFAFWLEQHGYDITYISNMDTHSDPEGLGRSKGLLSVGHDEYYSMEMFNHLRGAVARGLSIGFFSGNVCCGRIDPRPSSRGVANRVFSRTDFWGPRDEEEIARFPTMGLLPHRSPNSSTLVGAGNVPPTTGGADWMCDRPEHWIFEGTGMKAGEGIPGLVGWEWHGDPAKITGLLVLGSAPTQSAPGKPNGGTYTATIYPGPKNNFVFNASTCWWADGLAEPPGYVRPSVYTTPNGPDKRAQRITANILNRMTA